MGIMTTGLVTWTNEKENLQPLLSCKIQSNGLMTLDPSLVLQI